MSVCLSVYPSIATERLHISVNTIDRCSGVSFDGDHHVNMVPDGQVSHQVNDTIGCPLSIDFIDFCKEYVDQDGNLVNMLAGGKTPQRVDDCRMIRDLAKCSCPQLIA